MDMIKRILIRIKPYRGMVAVGIIMLLTVLGTRLVAPLITRVIIDEVIKNLSVEGLTPEKHAILIQMILLFIGLALSRMVCNYLRGHFFETISQSVIYDLRRDMYTHLQELPFRFYDENRIGEIMSRMTGDVEGIRNFVSNGLVQIVENFVYLIGALVILFTLSWKLALAIAMLAPLLSVVTRQLHKKIRPAWDAVREQNAVLNTRAQENIAGVRVVKAFAQEEHEKERFDSDNTSVLNANLKAIRIWSNFYPILEFVSSMISPIVILFGGLMVINGSMTLGTLVAFNSYIWMIAGPMRMLGNITNMLTNTASSSEKIMYYLDLGSYIKDKDRTKLPAKFEGRVEFDHVDFRHKDLLVLKDINLKVEPGQTVAVMGATGAGKTSVVNLLSRFYEVSSGRLLIDGVDVRDYPVKELRRHIGQVMQESFLFSESVYNNVCFGVPEANREQVEEATKIAQAHEFIMEMQNGYDTIIGERGLGLSGGQRQRVAMARALCIKPAILVLDDSTSAVDMETEFLIQKGLEQVMKGRTTFIIAHRISSVKNADIILVLENGGIAEQGSHASLLRQKGLYYQMYMDQYKDFASIGLDDEGVG